MRLTTLAALVSGGAASVIPAAAVDPLERRLIQTLTPVSLVPFQSPSTCASYVTVTETPALLTLTETRYATVTSETVTSTQTSLTESTLEATRTATITQFETSFVTETATVATETATQQPIKVQKKVVEKRQKKRDSCKRRSSSSQASASETSSLDSASASPTSSSVDNVSVTSSSADVCTATVTAAALKTTTTLTLTDSATATNVDTITSVIVATITTTVSTTDSETTAVPTTLSVTATTVVTAATPSSPAPTFYLRADALSGTVSNLYLRIKPDFSGTNRVNFDSNDQAGASLFSLNDDGSVVSVLNPDQTLVYSPGNLAVAIFRNVTTGQTAAQCQLNGITTPGSTGSFECPNGLSGLSALSDDVYGGHDLVFTQPGSNDIHFPNVWLQYVVPGDATNTTTPTVTTPAPPPASPSFAIRAAGGGTYDGQYLRAIGSVEAGSVNSVVFTSDPGSAIAFTLQGATSVVLALHPEHVFSYEPGTNSYAYVSEQMDGMAPAACQLTGDTTTVGAVGEFACPNGDSGLSVFSVDHGIDNTLVFDQIGDLNFEPVGLEYVILGNSTATTPVVTTPPPPQRTPAFILTAVGGSVDGQVLKLEHSVDTPAASLIFTPTTADALAFTLRADGSLVPASLAADPLNYAGYIANDSDGISGSSIAIETPATAAANGGDFRVSCQLSGAASTDVGSTGFFTCPNNGSSLHVNSDIQGYLLLEDEAAPFEHITVQYTFVS